MFVCARACVRTCVLVYNNSMHKAEEKIREANGLLRDRRSCIVGSRSLFCQDVDDADKSVLAIYARTAMHRVLALPSVLRTVDGRKYAIDLRH